MPCLVHMSCPFNISSHWPDSQPLITCSQVVSCNEGERTGRGGGEQPRPARAIGGPVEMLQTIPSSSLTLPFDFNSLFLLDVPRKGHTGHKTKGWVRAGLFLNLLFSFLPHPAFSRFSVSSLVSPSVCILLFLLRKGGAVRDHKNGVGFKPQKFEMLQ